MIKLIEYLKKLNLDFILALFLVIATTGCYAYLVYDRTLPFAEGWYTFYSQCINGGMIPYKDFDYLFFPFYLEFIAFFTKIFGYEIITLRILGILFFIILAVIIFLIYRNFTTVWPAAIASLVAVFYMQSEAGNVFYDYIRVMDIFADLAVLFLVLYAKRTSDHEYAKWFISLCGIMTSLFILIKQNMGLIFFAYALLAILLINIYSGLGKRQSGKMLILYILNVITPIMLYLIIMKLNGGLDLFLKCTTGSAIAAKGGMKAILFSWIYRGVPLFLAQIRYKYFAFLGMLFILKKYSDHSKYDLNEKRKMTFIGCCFCVTAMGLLIWSAHSEKFVKALQYKVSLSPYFVFVVVVSIMCYLLCHVAWEIYLKKQNYNDSFLILIVSGAYFAISYGCGTSGGLAEGQATLGIGLLIVILFNQTNFKYAYIIRSLFAIICLILIMQFTGKKLIYPYHWWGMDVSSYWTNTETINDIPLLRGILVSKETKILLESVNSIIQNKTKEDDKILCFPQIPIFYSLLNRQDVGVRAKVQWFDVASDATLESDIEVIKKNKPKAIIMYHTLEVAYAGHESVFRKGKISGTKRMREFLLNFVYENEYLWLGNFKADNNAITVWVKKDNDDKQNKVFQGGDGTENNPYLISSMEQFQIFKKMISEGRSFEGMYIQQIFNNNISEVDANDELQLRGFKGHYSIKQ